MGGSIYAADEKATDTPQPIIITSNTMEAIKKERLVIFKGKVVAQQKEFTVYSDELYVYYNEGEKEDIREIIAVGNVKMTQLDRVATGDRAVYYSGERRIVLTGNPQVQQGSDTVRGEKVIVFLDEDKSFVEGTEKNRVKAVIFPKKGSAGT
ncbi:MAG: lipopolysaccharide transport periplasmic protein LptA, partial [Deltaproteobacteria bacterium]|nr:lipopolysaccharide transport periplasmic protein LptA [Deltaproteobacteria bacterium]